MPTRRVGPTTTYPHFSLLISAPIPKSFFNRHRNPGYNNRCSVASVAESNVVANGFSAKSVDNVSGSLVIFFRNSYAGFSFLYNGHVRHRKAPNNCDPILSYLKEDATIHHSKIHFFRIPQFLLG
ncbi:hypothetical protein L1887_09838 [Cichorium endivia]|nr:hypothetical protein L1887_09838 [Cichorium endivia]